MAQEPGAREPDGPFAFEPLTIRLSRPTPPPMPAPESVPAKVRLDKLLWAARFFTTRSLAATAVAGGRVHVNGERVKPSKPVHTDDLLEITKGPERWTVAVRQLADRRGSATVAQTLYTETDESRAAREQHALERRFARALGSDLGARPTKQARRRLDAFRRDRRR